KPHDTVALEDVQLEESAAIDALVARIKSVNVNLIRRKRSLQVAARVIQSEAEKAKLASLAEIDKLSKAIAAMRSKLSSEIDNSCQRAVRELPASDADFERVVVALQRELETTRNADASSFHPKSSGRFAVKVAEAEIRALGLPVVNESCEA